MDESCKVIQVWRVDDRVEVSAERMFQGKWFEVIFDAKPRVVLGIVTPHQYRVIPLAEGAELHRFSKVADACHSIPDHAGEDVLRVEVGHLGGIAARSFALQHRDGFAQGNHRVALAVDGVFDRSISHFARKRVVGGELSHRAAFEGFDEVGFRYPE